MKENQGAPTKLLLSNVPVNCGDEYLRQWVEARGYSVSDVKLITDLVSGTSPAFAYVQLMNSGKTDEAIRALDGQTIQGHRLHAERVSGAAK
jgi:hypothetical protein